MTKSSLHRARYEEIRGTPQVLVTPMFNVFNLSFGKETTQILYTETLCPLCSQIKEGLPLDKWPVKPGLKDMIFHDFPVMAPKG